ncbi:GTP pyrophosphokinase [Sphingomonas glacialis]|uniref:(P)ppGpp synthetase n=1 Tax=Sphingomonas glacialis TaxID=658225 RepID=A0A502FR63_9SPHN|nr:RelA/SpoT domain-containing protein [Sphingomonas glacialis]TPG52038.1 (p)ppGpp synthetase [Sphingomonas glacialis]
MPSLDFDAEKAAFRDYYDDSAVHLEQAKGAFLTLLRSLLTHGQHGPVTSIGRIKDREESIKKFARKYQGELEEREQPYEIRDHITDLIGLRLICLYEDQIERIGAMVRENFEVVGETDKTAEVEGTEDVFGYKGLHLDLKLRPDRAAMPGYDLYASDRFELQIRTIMQDSWSTLDHEIQYKKSIPAPLRRRINTLAALFELADREFRQVRDETQVELRKAAAEAEIQAAGDSGEHAVGGVPDADVEPGQFAPLDSFRLLRIAHHFFKDVEFEPRKIDGFTAEVVKREPGISRGKFNRYLVTWIGTVRRYKAQLLADGKTEKFNAFTEMRHALYAANRDSFATILNTVARKNFDAWLASDVDQPAGTERAPAQISPKGRGPRRR